MSVAQPVRAVVKCLLRLWRSFVNNTGDVIRVISGKEATQSIINRQHALQTGCVEEETHGGLYICTKIYGKWWLVFMELNPKLSASGPLSSLFCTFWHGTFYSLSFRDVQQKSLFSFLHYFKDNMGQIEWKLNRDTHDSFDVTQKNICTFYSSFNAFEGNYRLSFIIFCVIASQLPNITRLI